MKLVRRVPKLVQAMRNILPDRDAGSVSFQRQRPDPFRHKPFRFIPVLALDLERAGPSFPIRNRHGQRDRSTDTGQWSEEC